MTYYVYILTSRRNGTLYVGVTNNLIRRVFEHRNNLVKGFTEKYGVHTLAYYEDCQSIESAIRREKQLKEWQRKWKLSLIEETNPEWRDLYDEIAPGFRLPACAGTGFAGMTGFWRPTHPLGGTSHAGLFT